MITYDDVREIALTLPGSYEQPSHGGQPSWRTKPRMFAWIREDPEALVVWVDSIEEKQLLIENDPRTFFTTDHYDGYPVVLVRLDVVDRDEAAELIAESWAERAPKKLVKEWRAAQEA